MSWPAIAEDNRLNERCPAQVVHMIKWSSGTDKRPHNLGVTQVRGSNQGGTIVTAGDIFRARSQGQGGF